MMLDESKALSGFMRVLRDEYGFDTVAARRQSLHYLPEPGAGARVLDIGTGSGWMAMLAADRGFRVTSIDLDGESLGRARQRAKVASEESIDMIQFVRGNALYLPFIDGAFDAVVSFDAMHHLAECYCPISVVEMLRVCKEGGHVIISDLNPDGIKAVRALHVRAGLIHEENSCGVNELETILVGITRNTTRHDGAFVSTFDVRRELYAAPPHLNGTAYWRQNDRRCSDAGTR